MDTSGRPREGWMTVVPVTVFLLFVVLALGGPTHFVNTVSLWMSDIAQAIVGWIKDL